VIDLIGGLVFMIATMIFAYLLFNWWIKVKGEEPFSYPDHSK